MTRENKLALVVGFGLVLLVGILVSDHFSPARGDRAAAPPPATAPVDSTRAEATDLIALAPPPAPAAPAAPAGMNEARLQTAATNVTRMDGRSEVPPVPRRETPAPAPATTPGLGAIEMGGGLNRPIIDDDVLTHRVEPGEALAAICRRVYGDPGLAGALARYNDIDDPARVRAGALLRLPRDPRVLGGTGLPVAAGGSTTEAPAPAAAPATSNGDAAEPRTYVVRSGDVLSRIAQAQCGTVQAMDEIVAMNRDVIDSPDDIRVGMTLRLPPRRDG